MKRFYLLPLLAIILTFAAATQAQTATPVPTATPYISEWCHVLSGTDFVPRVFGGQNLATYNSSLDVWDSVDWSLAEGGGTSYRRGVQIVLASPITANIVRVDINMDFVLGTFNPNVNQDVVGWTNAFGTPLVGALSRDFVAGYDSSNDFSFVIGHEAGIAVTNQRPEFLILSSKTFNFAGYSGTARINYVRMYGNGSNPFGSNDCPSSTPTPEGTEEPDVPAYARPLITEDIGPWGMVRHDAEPDTPQADTVLAFSNEPNAFVRAGAEGTVQSITKMRNYDCPHYFDGGTSVPFGTCSFTLSDDITGSGQHDYHLPGDSLSPLNGERDFYEVVIDVVDSDDTLHYLVASAPQYVEEGQIVATGCVIGRSMVMKGLGLGFSSGGIDLGVAESPYGVTVVTVENPDGTIIDGLPLLTEEPPVEPPCNQAENFAGCLGDATLSDPQSWKTKNATFTGSGVIIDGEGYIQTTMNLDSAQLPEMIVYARGMGINFKMQLGQTAETFTNASTVGVFADYVIAAAEHEPDLGSMYTVKVSNLFSSISLEIGYICVRHTGGEDLDPPSGETGTCTVLNHNFYAGTENWDGNVSAISGGVAAPDGEAISQNVTLEAGTYYLKISLQLHYVNFTPDAADTTNKLLVEYEFPASDGYETAREFTAAEIAKDKNVLIIKVPFTVASTTSSDFSVRATLDGFASNPVYGVIYSVICIVPTSQDGPLVETCTPMAEPSGDAVGSWTRWLWHNQNQFFLCTLMITLNNMYNVQVQGFKLFGWSQRYMMATTQATLDWMGYSFLPWTAGYLSNIQPAILTQDAGCNSMWCLGEAIVNGLLSIFDRLFDTLDWLLKAIVQPIFDLILWLVTGLLMLFLDLLMAIIGLFFLFLIELIQLFLLAKDLLVAIVTAWNTSTPTALPGLWDCSDTINIHPVCWILWMLENTLFAGSAGGAIIPVVVGLAYIIFTINIVKRIIKMVRDAGTAL